MSAVFTVRANSPASLVNTWERLVDWPRHARHVPFTTITLTTAPPAGVGTMFVARTELGRFGFDDPMEVVAWDPPRSCRIEKRGPVLQGWAELTVEPHGDGSRVTWRELVRPARLPGFADPAAAAAGRLLFGRVLRRLLSEPT